MRPASCIFCIIVVGKQGGGRALLSPASAAKSRGEGGKRKKERRI